METAKLGEEFKVETAVAENNKYKLVLEGEKQGMLKIVGQVTKHLITVSKVMRVPQHVNTTRSPTGENGGNRWVCEACKSM
ncbi:hypothetical protein SDJN03_20929, partial [Cucurbita argyrosperma subsp. sororia]